MESVGEEKKLQALFSELKAADEQAAPRFAPVWNRATISPRRIGAFRPAFVAASALMVFILISLAVWSRYSQRAQQPTQPMRAGANYIPVTPKIENTPTAVGQTSSPPKIVVMVKRPSTSPELVPRRLVARRDTQLLATNRKLTREAKTISNWQSPTTALLSSSSDEIFSSLPQLNKSSSDLKSFLPTRSN